jgi:hypothetical protein
VRKDRVQSLGEPKTELNFADRHGPRFRRPMTGEARAPIGPERLDEGPGEIGGSAINVVSLDNARGIPLEPRSRSKWSNDDELMQLLFV